MEKQFELKKYGTVYPIVLKVASYMDGNLAIQMLCYTDGMWEPWNTLTVNLDGVREKDCAYIDTNNNGEEILAWILRYGLAVPTGTRMRSGYCIYPEFRFKDTVLREIDADGYEIYLDTFEKMRKGNKKKYA